MTTLVPARKKRVKSTQAATKTAVKPAIERPVVQTAAAPKAPTVAARKAAGARRPAPAAVDEPQTAVKAKLVRDSFTIPKPEYETLAALKRRALGLGIAAKKSELIRAGIAALDAMSESGFKSVLESVPNLKTGRPKGVSA